MPALDDNVLGALLKDDVPCGDLSLTARGTAAQLHRNTAPPREVQIHCLRV
jgi:hypothetical protein